jgi:hypothetical protein
MESLAIRFIELIDCGQSADRKIVVRVAVLIFQSSAVSRDLNPQNRSCCRLRNGASDRLMACFRPGTPEKPRL